LQTSAHYSLGYGLDMDRLAGFQGSMGRFGQTGSLDVINAVMKKQGLGPGQYNELLSGMEEIFQSGLGSGIVKNQTGIARSQEYFGRMGDQYKGKYGTNLLNRLDQTAQGATGLGRQEDIFLYRAASELNNGDFLNSMKMLEGGFTGEGGVDLFKGVMGQLNDFASGGKDQMIKQIKNTMRVSYPQAEDLYNLYKKDGEGLTAGALKQSFGGTYGESTESQYTGNVEIIKQTISSLLGEKAFDLKAKAVSMPAELVRIVASDVYLDVNELNARDIEQKNMYDKGFRSSKLGDIEEALYHSTGTPEMEDKEDALLERLRQARKSGVDISPVTDMYWAKKERGQTGVSMQSLDNMNILLSQIVNNTAKPDGKQILEMQGPPANNNEYQRWMYGGGKK